MASRRHVPRVFVNAPLAIDTAFELDADKRHHLGTVLRLGAGARVLLFNGDGREYAARIDSASRKAMTLAVEQAHAPQRESPLKLTLVQAIARGDRMDFALAKAVELGVACIQPVFTDLGTVKLDGQRLTKKANHWQSVVESAAEQSGRLVCPRVAAAVDLDMLLADTPRDDADLRLMLAPTAAHGLSGCGRAERVALLVGPESGLSEREIDAAGRAGWTPLALGPRVLRTETAGMAALAAIQSFWGDLG